MRIVSWNVNGVRSATKKGMLEWLAEFSPDILCLQEVKARTEDLEESILKPMGYESFWLPARKRGYSGVAVYSKIKTEKVVYGLGEEQFDSEGRVIIVHYKNFVLINAYFPNSQRELARLPYKLAFCKSMLNYCEEIIAGGGNVIICGDFNIAHKEIDLRNPKENIGNAGFLPEERAWLDTFIDKGYVDTFREFSMEKHQYTWWSYMPGIRARNIGWRLDYHFVNRGFMTSVKNSTILPKVMGSDHCPVLLELHT